LWSGSSNALRILQPAPNADFGIEAHFDSTPSGRNQLQGLVVQQNDATLLRMGTYSDATKVYVFAAHVMASGASSLYNQEVVGATPQYLRVVRSGDNWTYSTSLDGSAWQVATTFTRALTVTEVGVYAGNAFNNVAYESSVDYFSNLANPVTAPNVITLGTNKNLLFQSEAEIACRTWEAACRP